MSIAFGSNVTVISSYWTAFKSVVQSKFLLMQYVDDGVNTSVFAFDGPSLAYSTTMWDASTPVPYGVVGSGYAQAQNDSDLADFTANFKPTANQKIGSTAGNNRLNTMPVADLETMAMLGLIPGCVAGRANGYALAGTTSQFNVRGSTYAPQASALQRSVKSSDARDTAAGTGARTVTINYLNNSMVLKQDTVTLNGTTPVNTNATDIQFIESIVVATCGTDLVNDGNVQLMTGLAGAGSVMAQMNSSDNSTFYAHHYVPAGVTCYILKNTGAGTLVVGKTWMNRTGDPRSTGLPVLQIGDTIIHSAGFTEDHDYKVEIAVAGPDYIYCKEQPVTANASNFAFASFDFMQF